MTPDKADPNKSIRTVQRPLRIRRRKHEGAPVLGPSATAESDPAA